MSNEIELTVFKDDYLTLDYLLEQTGEENILENKTNDELKGNISKLKTESGLYEPEKEESTDYPYTETLVLNNQQFKINVIEITENIAYGSSDDNVYIHNTEDWEEVKTLTEASDEVQSVEFLPLP